MIAEVLAFVGLALFSRYLMSLVFRRNLWPMILLHGFVDALSFTALYLGKQ